MIAELALVRLAGIVRALVSPQMSSEFVPFTAQSALVRPQRVVGGLVSLEMTRLREALRAHGALERLDLGVDAKVLDEIAARAERFAAVVALEKFTGRIVRSQMYFQIVLLTERLVAYLASKQTLASVKPQVGFQIFQKTKSFAAHRALELLESPAAAARGSRRLVSSRVFGEIRRIRKSFVAYPATMNVHLGVQSRVSVQLAPRRVSLLAVNAGVRPLTGVTQTVSNQFRSLKKRFFTKMAFVQFPRDTLTVRIVRRIFENLVPRTQLVGLSLARRVVAYIDVGEARKAEHLIGAGVARDFALSRVDLLSRHVGGFVVDAYVSRVESHVSRVIYRLDRHVIVSTVGQILYTTVY